MLQEFTLGGVTYIRVLIPEWMCSASKLLADHTNRGDVFAVHKRTGALHIISETVWKMANDPTTYPITRVEGIPEVDVQFYRNKLREISANAKAALGE